MNCHPYTYSCDLIRGFGPIGPSGMVLSRSDASQIRQGIAKALGMEDEALAIALSNYYQANETAIAEANCKKVMQGLGMEPQHL